MRQIFLCLVAVSAFCVGVPPMDFSDNQKIAMQNSILAQVNGTTISMMDVKKKMDMVFHQNYSHLAHSSQARYQFYETSWRPLLMEMIDHQLILADATEKEVKLTDGEIREEMEERFGPNIMFTLDKIGLTYNEAWNMTKEELIVRRMTWWFIHAKAMNNVTPQDIRQAFRLHLKEHPAHQEWKYRVISVRGADAEKIAEKVYTHISQEDVSLEFLATSLQTIDPSIQISSEFTATDDQLSDAHKTALANLSPGKYSAPIIQKSRIDANRVARIFYLAEKIDHPAAQFEELSHNLRNELVQKAASKESLAYMTKLRARYGFDPSHLKEKIPDNLHPFSLETMDAQRF